MWSFPEARANMGRIDSICTMNLEFKIGNHRVDLFTPISQLAVRFSYK